MPSNRLPIVFTSPMRTNRLARKAQKGGLYYSPRRGSVLHRMPRECLSIRPEIPEVSHIPTVSVSGHKADPPGCDRPGLSHLCSRAVCMTMRCLSRHSPRSPALLQQPAVGCYHPSRTGFLQSRIRHRIRGTHDVRMGQILPDYSLYSMLLHGLPESGFLYRLPAFRFFLES